MKFATKCVHSGSNNDPYGAVNPSIQLSTTFRQSDVAKPIEFDYIRGGNPTRQSVEVAIALLEGGKHGFAFASGLAAMDTLLATCQQGDKVVCAEDAYGGTIRLLRQVASRRGIHTTFVDTMDLAATQLALQGAKWCIMETPTNPLLRVSDIRAIAQLSHEAGAKLVVDNTFMSPALQTPLVLGADVVFHSATKYLGGHSDVLAGALVCNDELQEELQFMQMSIGGVLGPFDSFLLLRGLRTLNVRMDRACQNALEIATRLSAALGPQNVMYPGLSHHPNHAVHMGQSSHGGAMVSFRVADAQTARHIATGTKVWQLAESLGAVESLIQVPAAMTHASVPKEMRERTGLTDGVIRLSVGIEDVEDLWHDLVSLLPS